MKKPIICMVADHGCIRVFKEGNALVEKGYEVHILTIADPFGFNIFASFGKFLNAKHGTQVIETYDKIVDIFHVHNEPDWIVPMVRAGTKKPIIFDVHDLESMRRYDIPDPIENNAFKCANGFVHVSEGVRRYAENYHQTDKPSIVLSPFVNKRFMPRRRDLPKQPCFDSIVYEGGLSVDDELEDLELSDGRPAKNINLRYYVPMVNAFRKDGYQVTLFSAHEVQNLTYHELGACVINSMVYPNMLIGLRTHGLGFVGSCVSAPLMEAANPNKLYEYMSQGVVPVSFNCENVEEFLEGYECGVILESLENVRDQVEACDLAKMRENILRNNESWIMEHNIEPLMELYEEVL